MRHYSASPRENADPLGYYQARLDTDRKLKNQIRHRSRPPSAWPSPSPKPHNPYRPGQARSPHQARVRCRAPISGR